MRNSQGEDHLGCRVTAKVTEIESIEFHLVRDNGINLVEVLVVVDRWIAPLEIIVFWNRIVSS
jgi:hypothetical protein